MTSAPPTIAHVLHRLHSAGAEVLAAELARRLRERFRFVFFCLDEVGPLGQRLMGEGFKVVDLRRRPGVDWRVARRLAREVERYGVDLLHAHQYTPFCYAALARRWGTGHEPRLLFTEHGRHYPDGRRWRRVFANRLLLKRGDRVTAVGRFIRQALTDYEAIDERRIRVIYNGIDPDAFPCGDAGRAARAEARRALGIRDGESVILQVARFHPVKDHATAIRAFVRVLEEGRVTPSGVRVSSFSQGGSVHGPGHGPGHEPADTWRHRDARLVLVGDGEEGAAIRGLVEQFGLGGRVQFLGARDDVPSLLPAADVFLLTSLSEGISITLLEAMAAGLPIVATQVGGNPEVVEHGYNGLLAQRGDDAGLANNLLTLLRDPHLRQRMGDAGRARLLERFTRQQMHDGYARVYEQALR